MEYNKSKPSRGENFYNNLGAFLMRECDQQSKIIRENERFNSSMTNLKPLEWLQLLINNQMVDQSIKELIQIKDAKCVEFEYAHRKFGDRVNLIDLVVRNTFNNEAMLLLLKSAIKFNHYATRELLINKEM